MDNTQQGMRVSVLEEQSGRVIVDGSTEDKDERHVHLDSLDLSSSKSYSIKYEFFEKNVGLRSFEDKTISAGHMGASACSKPFVVQELVISSKQLIVERAQKYHDSVKDSSNSVTNEHDLSEMGKYCDFTTFDNSAATLDRGEAGVYCTRQTYRYSLAGQAPQELNVVYQKSFSIVGAAQEAVTYLFDLTLGFDFATSA